MPRVLSWVSAGCCGLLLGVLLLGASGCRQQARQPAPPAAQELAARKAKRPAVLLFMSADAPIPADVRAAVSEMQEALGKRVDVVEVHMEAEQEGLAKKHGITAAPSIALVGGKSRLTVTYVGISPPEAQQKVIAELKRLTEEKDVTPAQ